MAYLSQLRKRDASPTLVLVIVCAGVVLASLDLFIVNVALPSIARDLHQPNLGDALLGAQRLRDRVRGAAGRASAGSPRGAAATHGFLLGALIFTLPRRPAGWPPALRC